MTSPSARPFQSFTEVTAFIWAVADLLRGDYKQADYGKVILPFTVLRRLDCVLDGTRDKVLKKHEAMKGGPRPASWRRPTAARGASPSRCGTPGRRR